MEGSRIETVKRNLPLVAIIGRPNVGKSTLFNRISGSKKAIVEDIPGVTRDRNYARCEYNGVSFMLCDTGGFDVGSKDSIALGVKKQIERALEESDVIVYLFDVTEGLLPEDEEGIRIIRKANKPVFYVVNKIDSEKKIKDLSEFYALGMDRIFPISALHGRNLTELLESLTLALRAFQGEDTSEEEEPLKIAIIGRPNTGKSSIVNAIVGDERMITSEIPGTTRDAIDTEIVFHKRRFVIIDTAGIRKKSKVNTVVEVKSVASAIKTIERSDIVNLIVDAHEGVSHQEASLVHTVLNYGKGLVIVVNKWDLVETRMEEEEYLRLLRARIPHASFCPCIFVSALKKKNIDKILYADIQVDSEMKKRIETSELNRALTSILEERQPPSAGGRTVKIYYATQVGICPPSFVFFSNHPQSIPAHYKKYLENSLRERYGFLGCPLRLKFKKK
ncbi:MAG: ribosome biogenesis GTPase Der [Desulfobacterota bacterium]|nr:ribosome biogenesis GTPase Der [Thermodesulfobacteriota bacterium]MDW8001784.1 ribosome biogenesis GTPase Der [Deltaproteobacteria bacterium]